MRSRSKRMALAGAEITLLPMTISWIVVSSVWPAMAIDRPSHLPPTLMATDSSASAAKA